MKKKTLLSTLVITMCTLSSFAASKLSISITTPSAIKIVVDGRKFYSNNNTLTVNNLQPGYHNITVYYLKNGNDFNDFFRSGTSNRWKKAVQKQFTVRNNYYYDITVNRFGKVFYDQDYSYNNYGWRDGDDDDFDNTNGFDFDNGYDENYNDWDYFRKNNNLPNVPVRDDRFNNQSLNSNSFNRIKETAQKQLMDDSKINFLKQGIDNGYLSNSQIKELAGILLMEGNKLDFLKFAYSHSYNKKEYYTVTDALLMQGSKDELMEYIKNKR